MERKKGERERFRLDSTVGGLDLERDLAATNADVDRSTTDDDDAISKPEEIGCGFNSILQYQLFGIFSVRFIDDDGTSTCYYCSSSSCNFPLSRSSSCDREGLPKIC
ncbi:uncharacterized protein LOC110735118 isoform X2 [Chenopodium quinoa]|uniref:uncharacterized protein LOC110735118 isoform X2 n=1 Tax=Chenopodium quinoa TaxID=63459 RepID=UPI000B779760|nr:uncharacterized protein LOC110735118 isoform X2 [Chenopodium quinoa]